MFCLIFIMIIKIIVESQINKTGYGLKVQMPLLFNIPIYSKFKYANEVLKITSCEEVISLLKFIKLVVSIFF
jgi:hypothetical protein